MPRREAVRRAAAEALKNRQVPKKPDALGSESAAIGALAWVAIATPLLAHSSI